MEGEEAARVGGLLRHSCGQRLQAIRAGGPAVLPHWGRSSHTARCCTCTGMQLLFCDLTSQAHYGKRLMFAITASRARCSLTAAKGAHGRSLSCRAGAVALVCLLHHHVHGSRQGPGRPVQVHHVLPGMHKALQMVRLWAGVRCMVGSCVVARHRRQGRQGGRAVRLQVRVVRRRGRRRPVQAVGEDQLSRVISMRAHMQAPVHCCLAILRAQQVPWSSLVFTQSADARLVGARRADAVHVLHGHLLLAQAVVQVRVRAGGQQRANGDDRAAAQGSAAHGLLARPPHHVAACVVVGANVRYPLPHHELVVAALPRQARLRVAGDGLDLAR
mmetsp:Transcript_20426/g.51744  ORF Transcript_20426/g.51744 Transcript_20426/m.51744 type:complete len:330 (+) Transcript_20426:6349-7338(+)